MDEVTSGGFLISKIQKLSKRIFAKILKNHDININPGQGRILFILWQKDNIPIQELAVKTSLTMSTLTSMLDRMKKAKIITRVENPKDRRSYLIGLTPKTKAMKQQFLQISSDMGEIYYRGLSATEIHQFEATLKQIFQNLEDYAKKES